MVDHSKIENTARYLDDDALSLFPERPKSKATNFAGGGQLIGEASPFRSLRSPQQDPKAVICASRRLRWAVVSEVRASKSKPDRGVVKFAVTGVNQRGETVLTATMMIMAKRRQT